MGSIEDRRYRTDPTTGERSRTDFKGAKPYRARYRDPGGRDRNKSFARKRDAQVFLDSISMDMINGSFCDPALGRRTVGDWHVEWAKTRVDLRESTRERDDSYIRNHVLPRWATTPLARVDHIDVCAWVADLSASGKAPATVHKINQLLSKMLASAVRSGLIAANPCDGVPLPRIERKEQRFLEPAEVDALATAIDQRYAALIRVLAYCGLRASEAIGLQAENVDLIRGRLFVVSQLVETKGEFRRHPPKTAAGRRSVPIPRTLCDGLAPLLAGKEPSDLVFTAPNGGPIRLSLWRRRFFKPAVEAAGLNQSLRVHDLRHSAVALWIAAGASPKELAVRAGHSSVSTILDVYGHLLPETEQAVTDRLNQMLSESTSSASVVDLRDAVARRRA